MKMFFAIENNMNGALVIPKLMLIKFCCWKDRRLYRVRSKNRVYCLLFERICESDIEWGVYAGRSVGLIRSASGIDARLSDAAWTPYPPYMCNSVTWIKRDKRRIRRYHRAYSFWIPSQTPHSPFPFSPATAKLELIRPHNNYFTYWTILWATRRCSPRWI